MFHVNECVWVCVNDICMDFTSNSFISLKSNKHGTKVGSSSAVSSTADIPIEMPYSYTQHTHIFSTILLFLPSLDFFSLVAFFRHFRWNYIWSVSITCVSQLEMVCCIFPPVCFCVFFPGKCVCMCTMEIDNNSLHPWLFSYCETPFPHLRPGGLFLTRFNSH